MIRLAAIFTLLLSCPAWASLTNCQQAYSSTSTTTLALPSFVLTTVSDGIMVFVSLTSVTPTVSVADNGSGGSQTYSPIGSITGTTIAGYAFLATNATSAVNGATITVTLSINAVTVNAVACEVTSMATSSAQDGSTATSTGVTVSSLTSGALTTSNSGTDLNVYCVGDGSTALTFTAGSGYTIPSGAGATGTHSACQYKSITGAQSAVTTSMSWTGSPSHVAGLFFALKQASVGAAPGFDKRSKLRKLSVLSRTFNHATESIKEERD